MELIKIKEVSYKIHKKPEDMKMSDWSNFWKDKDCAYHCSGNDQQDLKLYQELES